MPSARLPATLLLVLLATATHAQEVATARLCDQAAARAEQRSGVPVGVLAAVGTVESGRGAGATPWPWTINADGQGYFFASKAEAVRAAAALVKLARFVDVGCFQVDLAFHGWRFASLEDAFDPARNAEVATDILQRGRFGAQDWPGAVARYHSATPSLGIPYLQKVRAAYTRARERVWSVLRDDTAPPSPVVLLSAQARRVRVLTMGDPAPNAAQAAWSPERAREGPPVPQIIHLPRPPHAELEADRR